MTLQTIDEAIDDAIADVSANGAKRKPVKSDFYRGISCDVFPKTIERDDGTQVTVFNTLIQSSYKDKDGKRQYSSWYSEQQLVILEDFAREARKHIREARVKKNG